MTNTIIKDEKDVLKLKIGTIIKPEDDKRPKNKKDPELERHNDELDDDPIILSNFKQNWNF